jgi:predicted RND superfamily exporter protein
MMVAGVLVIVIVLFLIYRRLSHALLPAFLIIIVLGMSPLTLFLLGKSYNPLTLGLSALVLGIGTEFTILILERYREELVNGLPVRESMITAVKSVGSAITVSGLTVVGGFFAIIFVSFPVLSSFGLITVLDTAYALIAALTLLPVMTVLLKVKKTNI